jgi:hypothetical protein
VSETSVKGGGRVIKPAEFQAERQVSCRWPARSTDTGVPPQPTWWTIAAPARFIMSGFIMMHGSGRSAPPCNLLRESDGDKTGPSLLPASKCKFGPGAKKPEKE